MLLSCNVAFDVVADVPTVALLASAVVLFCFIVAAVFVTVTIVNVLCCY